jgi:hypothetical protein
VILILALIVSLGLHVALGWQWTVLAALGAGLFSRRFGTLIGAAAVALEWALLILYSYVVAPSETGNMIAITGGLFGNLAPPLVVGSTVLLGVAVGLFGGLVGSLTRGFFNRALGTPASPV